MPLLSAFILKNALCIATEHSLRVFAQSGLVVLSVQRAVLLTLNPLTLLFALAPQLADIVKIQAFIRANKARDDYKTLSKYRAAAGPH